METDPYENLFDTAEFFLRVGMWHSIHVCTTFMHSTIQFLIQIVMLALGKGMHIMQSILF
jgi:hypothetical protein